MGLKVGNITLDDANQLVELTKQLYEYIYQHYEELGGAYLDMKPLLYGALEQVKARALENERKLQEEISRLKKQLEERN